MIIQKGRWVQIHDIVLTPENRNPEIPQDTKAVPLEMWVKGHLTADAEIGSACEVKTVTGRFVSGTLVEADPAYTHGFGDYVPELDRVRDTVRALLGGAPNE